MVTDVVVDVVDGPHWWVIEVPPWNEELVFFGIVPRPSTMSQS